MIGDIYIYIYMIMDCMSLSLNVLGYFNIRPTLIPHLHMRIRVHSPSICHVSYTPLHDTWQSFAHVSILTPYLSLSLKTHATHPRVRWEGTVVLETHCFGPPREARRAALSGKENIQKKKCTADSVLGSKLYTVVRAVL